MADTMGEISYDSDKKNCSSSEVLHQVLHSISRKRQLLIPCSGIDEDKTIEISWKDIENLRPSVLHQQRDRYFILKKSDSGDRKCQMLIGHEKSIL